VVLPDLGYQAICTVTDKTIEKRIASFRDGHEWRMRYVALLVVGAVRVNHRASCVLRVATGRARRHSPLPRREAWCTVLHSRIWRDRVLWDSTMMRRAERFVAAGELVVWIACGQLS